MARREAIRRLTTRDCEILHWIGQGGVANLSQVARRFWPGKQVDTALDRLRQLVKAGYLRMDVCDAQALGGRIFTLTKEGSLLFDPPLRESFYNGLLGVAEIGQQILAQEAYLNLEAWALERGSQLIEWKSERTLRAEFLRAQARSGRRKGVHTTGEIPDARAVFITTCGGREIVDIEIDGVYYGKMLCQKAEYLSKSGHQVVWVCTKARAGYIRRAVGGYPNIRVAVLNI